jgi:hypothetical protein
MMTDSHREILLKLQSNINELFTLLLSHPEKVIDSDGKPTEDLSVVAEWLNKHLIAGSINDCVTLAQLYKFFTDSAPSHITLIRFVRLAKKILKSRSNVIIYDRYQPRTLDSKIFLRNAIIGQRYVNPQHRREVLILDSR